MLHYYDHVNITNGYATQTMITFTFFYNFLFSLELIIASVFHLLHLLGTHPLIIPKTFHQG